MNCNRPECNLSKDSGSSPSPTPTPRRSAKGPAGQSTRPSPIPEDFSRLSVHVHYARPDEDIDLWVQPYLSYANEPSNEQVDKAAKAANAALTKAILPMPLITHQEFLDAKSKEDE